MRNMKAGDDITGNARTLHRDRIWELDFFRGWALLFMFYFHVVFDMNEFYSYPVTYASGINYYIGKASVILFMLVSGISCSLSRSNVRRGLRVLGIALVITLATHLYNPGFGVKFGVLHFFGISMLMAPWFIRLNRYVLPVLGTGMIILGYFTARINATNDYLFPFGITSSSFISSDYYPLLPWLGVFLYGIAMGKMLYSTKKSRIPLPVGNRILMKMTDIISRIGQRTLLVYVLHQPVIMLVLGLVNMSGAG